MTSWTFVLFFAGGPWDRLILKQLCKCVLTAVWLAHTVWLNSKSRPLHANVMGQVHAPLPNHLGYDSCWRARFITAEVYIPLSCCNSNNIFAGTMTHFNYMSLIVFICADCQVFSNATQKMSLLTSISHSGAQNKLRRR